MFCYFANAFVLSESPLGCGPNSHKSLNHIALTLIITINITVLTAVLCFNAVLVYIQCICMHDILYVKYQYVALTLRLSKMLHTVNVANYYVCTV